jgi:hypothetical protein
MRKIKGDIQMAQIYGEVISPTHKRMEGRAPGWGSEFTSKDATLQEGFSRNLLLG